MRKILLILFALLIMVTVTSCEPKVYKYPAQTNINTDNIDFHDAPFDMSNVEGQGYLKGYKSLSSQQFILQYNEGSCSKNMYESTSPDGSSLYVLRTVDDGEATLEVYGKCTAKDHTAKYYGCYDMDAKKYLCYRYENKKTDSITYYSLTPIMAYYFRFERNKYGFATKNFELGEAIEIKECWNIGPNRKEIEESSGYLSGFIFFTKGNDYKANVGVFCYRCEKSAYPDGSINICKPSYLYNQMNKHIKYDSFNADGERNEGWNTRISVLSGYASDAWQQSGGFDYPESLAHYKDDMCMLQAVDGTWYEAIVTKPEE